MFFPLFIALLFILVTLAITVLAPTLRTGAVTSIFGAAVVWVLIARWTYHTPIPLNEPEWWGGLAIACSLAAVGVTIGAFVRRRRDRVQEPLT